MRTSMINFSTSFPESLILAADFGIIQNDRFKT